MTFPRQQNRIMTEQVLDKIRNLTESATLNPYDHVVHVSDASGAVVVTLPSVAEAAGMFYVVRTTDGSGSNGVDIKAGADAAYTITEVDPSAGTEIDLSSAVAMDTAGDFFMVFSDGVGWIVVAHRVQ